LEKINLIVQEINDESESLASSVDTSLESFSPQFDKLTDQFGPVYDLYRLDEVVVAAIAPLVGKLSRTSSLTHSACFRRSDA
jgi:tuftelin-interacting protein 11